MDTRVIEVNRKIAGINKILVDIKEALAITKYQHNERLTKVAMNTEEKLQKVAELNSKISEIDKILSSISAPFTNTSEDLAKAVIKANEILNGIQESVIEVISSKANDQRAELLQQASELLK